MKIKIYKVKPDENILKVDIKTELYYEGFMSKIYAGEIRTNIFNCIDKKYEFNKEDIDECDDKYIEIYNVIEEIEEYQRKGEQFEFNRKGYWTKICDTYLLDYYLPYFPALDYNDEDDCFYYYQDNYRFDVGTYVQFNKNKFNEKEIEFLKQYLENNNIKKFYIEEVENEIFILAKDTYDLEELFNNFVENKEDIITSLLKEELSFYIDSSLIKIGKIIGDLEQALSKFDEIKNKYEGYIDTNIAESIKSEINEKINKLKKVVGNKYDTEKIKKIDEIIRELAQIDYFNNIEWCEFVEQVENFSVSDDGIATVHFKLYNGEWENVESYNLYDKTDVKKLLNELERIDSEENFDSDCFDDDEEYEGYGAVGRIIMYLRELYKIYNS